MSWQMNFEPRAAQRQKRPPAVSFKEMCEMVGINHNTMAPYLGRTGAPKPIGKSGTSRANTYYNGIEARAFCEALKKERA